MSIEFDLMRTHRRLLLRNHELQVQIGVHAFEKQAAQRVRFNVELWVPLATSTPRRDCIDEVVDYDFVRLIIRERVNRGPIELQETLADDVLARLLAHPDVRAARVRTEKLDVYSDCEAVGVEIFAMKPFVEGHGG